jgi:nucleotide-binding universal stress UspA family protein
MIVQPNLGVQNLARCADLVVVESRPDREPSARFVDPGDLVLKLGRPMLLAEASGAALLGEKVVIGWKDTREARRAIVDALPFLEQASEVFVGLVEERDYAQEWTSLKDVLHWLERHGIKVRGEIVPSAGTPAETIISTAASMGADLVVTGAYGHSRLREWLFGGVTQGLLGAPTTNRLMSN